jgi:hypothetical protein
MVAMPVLCIRDTPAENHGLIDAPAKTRAD